MNKLPYNHTMEYYLGKKRNKQTVPVTTLMNAEDIMLREKRPKWRHTVWETFTSGSRACTITIKSNPITAGWMTHRLENTCTTEVHPLEWRFWAPHQASQTGGPATGGGIPRESDFEGQWDLIAGLRQDWGKQRLHSWRAHTKYCAHRDPGEGAVTP